MALVLFFLGLFYIFRFCKRLFLDKLFRGNAQFTGESTDKVGISLKTNGFSNCFHFFSFLQQVAGFLESVHSDVISDGKAGLVLKDFAKPGLTDKHMVGKFIQGNVFFVMVIDILEHIFD